MKPHTLIVIGWLGIKRCYLDISKAEAIRLYTETEEEVPTPDQIREFTFHQQFSAYDVWASEQER